MLIAFNRNSMRTVGEYAWEPGGGPVEVNDPELLPVLLLQPGDGFEISSEEPMLQLPEMTIDRLGALALEGICGQSDLMGLDDQQVARLARAANVQPGVVVDWALHGTWLDAQSQTLEEG